jgi:ribonuclease HI
MMHADGGARGNPGPAGVGIVITDENGKVLKEIARYIGEQTNNFAEYEALIQGLEELKRIFGEKVRNLQVEVMMDSELVVRQCEGKYKVKDAGLKEQFARVARIKLESMPNMAFTHVPREKNAHADELVNKAIDERL